MFKGKYASTFKFKLSIFIFLYENVLQEKTVNIPNNKTIFFIKIKLQRPRYSKPVIKKSEINVLSEPVRASAV